MSSTVDPGMSIPQLIEIVKHSFRESEFVEVQNILMDREEKLKIEIENRRTDHESARLLEEKLRCNRKKFKELNHTISSLETRVAKMEKENEVLRQERDELKRRNDEAAHESAKKEALKLAESEKLRRSLKKCKELNATISSLGTVTGKMEKLEKELEVLRQDREELKRQNDDLRREKTESDVKAERYKIRVENLEPRVNKVEAALANLLNVKVENLAPLANALKKSDDAAAAEGKNVDIESVGVNKGVGNKNAIETEPQRCRRTDGRGWQCKRGALPNQKYCESHLYRQMRGKKLALNTQSVNYSLPHLDKGVSSTKDDGANTAQTSTGSQSSGSPHVDPQDPVEVTGAPAGDLIEISDTDDEPNCDDKVSDTSLTKRKKRSRIYISDEDDDHILIDGKENQDLESTHDKITQLNGVPCDDSHTHYTCTDSDDDSSCSDGHMNRLVASIWSKKIGST